MNQQLTLAFGGYSRVGKDTGAALVKESVREDVSVRCYKFADKVREECVGIGQELGIDPWTEDPVEKEVIRPHMIDIGMQRRAEDPGYWVKSLQRTMAEDTAPGIRIVTDLRYKNEARWLLGEKAILIILHRHGFGALNQEEERETSKLYDPSNPFSFRKDFRNYWWTHELELITSLNKPTKRERERKNLIEVLPELRPWLPDGGERVKVDLAYREWADKKGLKIPDTTR